MVHIDRRPPDRRNRAGRDHQPRDQDDMRSAVPEPLRELRPGEVLDRRQWGVRRRACFVRLSPLVQGMLERGESLEACAARVGDLERKDWLSYLEARQRAAPPTREAELDHIRRRRHTIMGRVPIRFRPGQAQAHDYVALRQVDRHAADELEALERRAAELRRSRPVPQRPPPTLDDAREQDLMTLRQRMARYVRRYKQEGGEFTTAAKTRWQPILDELQSIIRWREAEEYDAREREYRTAKRKAERDGVACLVGPPHRPRWMVEEDHAERLRLREERELERQLRVGGAVAAGIARATTDASQAVIDPKASAYRERKARQSQRREEAVRARREEHSADMIRRVLDWAWGAGRVAPGSLAALVPVGGETWIAYPDGVIAWQTQRARAIVAVAVRFDGGWAFPPVGAAGRECVPRVPQHVEPGDLRNGGLSGPGAVPSGGA